MTGSRHFSLIPLWPLFTASKGVKPLTSTSRSHVTSSSLWYTLSSWRRGSGAGHSGSCSLLYGLGIQCWNKITTPVSSCIHWVSRGGA